MKIKNIEYISEAEFVGKLPVRTEIAVLSADKPKDILIGWKIPPEKIGIGIYNPRGVENPSISTQEYRIYF